MTGPIRDNLRLARPLGTLSNAGFLAGVLPPGTLSSLIALMAVVATATDRHQDAISRLMETPSKDI